MELIIKNTNPEVESFNVFIAINGWKSKLSGGLNGLFFFKYEDNFIDSIKNKELREIKHFIIKKLKNIFNSNHHILLKKNEELKTSWEIHNHEFLKEIEVTFGKLDKKIKCYLIMSCGWGSYDINKNEVYVFYGMNNLLYTLCHEIYHLYYYNFLNKNYKGYDELKAWKLSEIIVNFSLIRGKLQKLWPNEKEYYYEKIDVEPMWKDWNNMNIKRFLDKYIYLPYM